MFLRPLSSFYGPELSEVRAGEAGHFLTLSHWIETRKFHASIHGDLIEYMLLLPGEHEVRRFAKRNSSKWRSDWQLIRPQVVSLGVAYYILEKGCSDLQLSWLEEEVERAGMSSAMAKSICHKGRLMAAAPKVCVLAEFNVPVVSLNRRLRLINKRFEDGICLVHWRGRYGSDYVHSWAMNSGFPVLYAGAFDMRTTGREAIDLHEAADHYYVFDRKNEKKADRTIAELRSKGKSCDLVLWQSGGTGDLFQ